MRQWWQASSRRKPSMASPTQTPPVPVDLPRVVVMPLEPGDHLTRDEFERRYEAMPHVKKAELIEGVVHIPSPVRWDYHAEPHAKLIAWLVNYESATPGVRTGDNGSVRLDLENEPQPDAILLIEQSAGGQSKLSSDHYLEGAP